VVRRPRRFLLAFALALAALAAVLWRAREAPRPSVLLVTVDTLRPDFVGPGYATPALEAFHAQATRFSGARTPVPLTYPAHVSILTGLVPGRHAIHDNTSPPLPRGRTYPLLAEEFRAAGYATAAFVSTVILRGATGLDAGFDAFTGPEAAEPHFLGERETPAEETAEAALRWLAARPPDPPVFLWVHFYDCHWPYLPFPGDGLRPPVLAGADPKALYAGEVRRVDAALGRLLAAVGPDVVVVVVSDHGEGLGEHHEPGHGALCFGSTADAYLAARGPGMAPGAVDADVRSVCDVAPTLRRWCGLPARATDGRPLDGPGGVVVCTESLLAWREHNWAQCFSASDGRYTLVESGSEILCFDRATDRFEKRPLSAPPPEVLERLDRALLEARAIVPLDGIAPAGDFVLTPYGAGSLRPTQYLPRPANFALRNPATRLDWRTEFERALHELADAVADASPERIRAPVAALEALHFREPENPAPGLVLVEAYARLGALTRRPDDAAAAARWGRVAFQAGHRSPRLLHQVLASGLESGSGEEIRLALELALASAPLLDDPGVAAAVRAAARLAEEADEVELDAARTALQQCWERLDDTARARMEPLRQRLEG